MCGIFGYIFLRASLTWLSIVYIDGYGGRYYKEIGEFGSLQKCRDAAESSLKVGTKLSDEKVASQYLCGRGCYVDPFNRDPMLDDYQCLEKVAGTLPDKDR